MGIKIGFIVNPIAGMGGAVGLKGTDGVYEKAVELGAKPKSSARSFETIKEFIKMYDSDKEINWFTCSDDMGENELKKVGVKNYEIIYEPKSDLSTFKDTLNACKKFLSLNVDIILFCGGDGTARDIVSVIKKKIPILGIPSGVKMHSAVFGINPQASAKMLNEYILGHLRVGESEIIDLDEKLYRKGIWKVKLFDTANGLIEPTYIQVGKAVFSEISETDVKDELTEHILDEIKENKDVLYLFGSGGTIDYIAGKIGVKNSLLGIDAVINLKTIGIDLNENEILDLLDKYSKVKVILSPIGAQGFILGRGNLQLSPKVIKKIGIENLIVISTPAKILATPFIRVDTGDKALDEKFVEYEMLMVVIGYRLSRVMRIQIN
jgi:predicted polyphosphate/ATP-dependent NAD kinase